MELANFSRPFAFVPLDGKAECLEMPDLNLGPQTRSLLFTSLLGWVFCLTQLGKSPGTPRWPRKD